MVKQAHREKNSTRKARSASADNNDNGIMNSTVENEKETCTNTKGPRKRMRRITYMKVVLVAAVLCGTVYQWRSQNSRSFGMGRFTVTGTANTISQPASTGAEDQQPTNKNQYDYIPCRLKLATSTIPSTSTSPISRGDTNNTDHAKRFQTVTPPMANWTCRQEIPSATNLLYQNNSSYFLVFVDFQIQECPPYYAASTFQLQASTKNSRTMGTVGERYKFKDGCGWYNASIAIMDMGVDDVGAPAAVTLELFWTSVFRKYSNHMSDVHDAHVIKTEGLGADQIKATFTKERLNYLDRYLDPIAGFPLEFTIELQQQQQQQTSAPPIILNNLPDCATIPLDDWSPAGTFHNPSRPTPWDKERSAEVNPRANQLYGDRRPMQAARCSLPWRSRTEWNTLLAGLRIRMLGDSHGERMTTTAWMFMCPSDNTNASFKEIYHDHWYDCTSGATNNSFQYFWKGTRGTYKDGFEEDFDNGVSTALRTGSLEACQTVLGLGLYNATILLIPHWLFVYETNEGLDDFLLGLQSMLENCQEAFPDQMNHHVFLVQTSTARDSFPSVGGGVNSWRGIHNHRLEAFSQKLRHHAGLRPYIAGIIPAFEMTYARMREEQTLDGTHLAITTYRDMLHVQFTAVRSALLHSRGIHTPAMAIDDPKARWFVGESLI